MVLPKSQSPIKKTSIPGIFAIPSTCSLISRVPTSYLDSTTHILKRLLGLDLNDGEQDIVRMLQVLDPGDSAGRTHGERVTETSPNNGRELGRLDQSVGIVRSVK